MKRLLLWDFDGVICNSMDECLLTSYNAYRKYRRGDERLATQVGDVPDRLRDHFYRTRQYVRRPGEYLVLYVAFETGDQLVDSFRFGDMLSELTQNIQGYEEAFFSGREVLRKAGLAQWLNLHRGYPWINEKWESLKEYFEFYIVSNKDLFSIGMILHHLNLSLSQNHIFGKEFGMDKYMIIQSIMSTKNIPREKVYFIDDHYAHLMGVAHLGVRLFFAEWGYGKFESGAHNGIVLLHKDRFAIQLKEGAYE